MMSFKLLLKIMQIGYKILTHVYSTIKSVHDQNHIIQKPSDDADDDDDGNDDSF